jgi:hypothetical protein
LDKNTINLFALTAKSISEIPISISRQFETKVYTGTMEAQKLRKLSLQDTETMDIKDRSPSPNYDNYPKVKCDNDHCQVISMKHYNMILSELRCPGCSDAMVAPIRLCLRGHSLCNSCVGLSSLNKCPLCQVSTLFLLDEENRCQNCVMVLHSHPRKVSAKCDVSHWKRSLQRYIFCAQTLFTGATHVCRMTS